MNTSKPTIPFIILFLGMTFSCERNSVTKEECIAYIQDEGNGLLKKRNVGNTEIELLYTPSELLFDGIGQRVPYNYFVLKVSKNGKALEKYFQLEIINDPTFSNRLHYGLGQYFYLVSQTKDTLLPLDIGYNNLNVDMKATTMTLVFDTLHVVNNTGYIDVYLKEFGLDTGTLMFRFNLSDIEKIPQLRKTT